MINIYVDGSTREGKNQKGADNKGGYSVIILNKEEDQLLNIYSLQCSNTTNNRMELSAILTALEYADNDYPNEQIHIYSDSAYCINICTDWIYNWQRNGWKTASKKTPENLDLVMSIYKHLTSTFVPRYCFHKVNGHSEIIGNELADAAATNNWHKFNQYMVEYEITAKEGVLY